VVDLLNNAQHSHFVEVAMLLPNQMLVQARIESQRLNDPATEVRRQLEATVGGDAWQGRRTAVAVGSRGIDRQPEVVAAIVRFLRDRGAQPFIMPAMGSHGGATAEGQADMLRTNGVTEEVVGAEIYSTLDTIDLGRTLDDVKVLAARDAMEADGVILVNRIKPHTDFAGTIGSGLMKLCAIGLGKVAGAAECHRAAARLGHELVIRSMASMLLGKVPIVCGVALLEDSLHQLARIEVIRREAIEAREEALFVQAKQWMPKLPFTEIDVLIIDEIGKNISGAGMDTNVIGRGVDGAPRADRHARVGAIWARDLTPDSHGNAIGLGLADIVSSRLVTAMDPMPTYTNALSSMTPATARVPIHFPTDAACLRAALRMAGAEEDPQRARIVRVRNTLMLSKVVCSAAYADEIESRSDLDIVTPSTSWSIAADGNFDPSVDLLGAPAHAAH
jgi:Domain of unknown function (DUF362)